MRFVESNFFVRRTPMRSGRASSTGRRAPPRRLLVAAVMGSAFGLTTAASAQTRFDWPDTTVQVAHYTTVEQCLAAIARVRTGLEVREARTVWRDTVVPNPHEKLDPAPASVTATAERCAARFAEPAADLADFAPLMQLYLAAGRDADAAALVTRRLGAVSAKAAHEERAAVADTAAELYLKARPVRLDAAEQILLARVHDGTDRLERIQLYYTLMNGAAVVDDTARARRAAKTILAVADSLTKAERESEKFDNLAQSAGGNIVFFNAMYVLTGVPTMLDSLRHGTAAFVALEGNMWTQATKERPEAMPFPVGERAPAITADRWFPSDAAGTRFPAPGRVSLIRFLDHQHCADWRPPSDLIESCGRQLAELRRLSERFPTIQVIIVSRIHGSFLYVAPPSPAEEAELVRQWIEPYRIRGAVVAVSSTPFWNLPAPDGRRIERDTPAIASYHFGKIWDPERGTTLLIDQDGTVLTGFGFGEPNLSQFIDILLHREGSASDHAAN